MTSPSPEAIKSTAEPSGVASPFVSILINNYNYRNYLPEALESALNQTYEAVEVIVVDDGSTDQSRQVIEQYCAIANAELPADDEENGPVEANTPIEADTHRQRLVPVFKPNGGQASAFNAGIAASHGDIVCFLDADDYFALEKVSRVVAYFADHPEAGWLFHELEEVDADGKNLGSDRPVLQEFAAIDFRPALAQGEILPYLPATSGLCFRRETLMQLQAIPEELRICADSFLRLASTCVAAGLLVPDRLAVHRMHGNNFYEQRSNISFMDAATDIKASYYLKRQFPQASAYADRLFSHAVGQLAGQDSFQKVMSVPEAKAYLQQHFGVGNSLGCGMRIAYNYFRSGQAV